MSEPPITSETVRIKTPDGESVEAQLTYFPDYAKRVACLQLRVPGFDPLEAREHDYFECLVSVRRRLETLGAKAHCWGARRDVWPSGMQRDMGAGLTAYRLGNESTVEEQSIFSPATEDAVATVDEQQQFAESWYRRRNGPDNHTLQRTGAASIVSRVREWFRRGPGR